MTGSCRRQTEWDSLCLSVAVPSSDTMDVYEQTSSSMKVKWDSVKGATGYILLYRPINQPQLEKEVDSPHPTE